MKIKKAYSMEAARDFFKKEFFVGYSDKHNVPVYNTAYGGVGRVTVIRGGAYGFSGAFTAGSDISAAPAPAATPTPNVQISTETNPDTGLTGIWAFSALALSAAAFFARKKTEDKDN